MARAYTNEQIDNGRRKLWNAEQWRRNNPDAWRYIVGKAKQLAKDGQTISGRALIEDVRRKAFIGMDGTDTKTSNDYAPIMARWLIAEYPEMSCYIEQRSTVFDILVA